MPQGQLRRTLAINKQFREAQVERQVLAEALEMQLRLYYGEKYGNINAMREKLKSVMDGSIHKPKGEG